MQLEGAVRGSATGVDNTLWDALVIEAMDLLTASVVLEKHWASLVFAGHLQPIVCVGLLYAIVGCDSVARRCIAVLVSAICLGDR